MNVADDFQPAQRDAEQLIADAFGMPPDAGDAITLLLMAAASLRPFDVLKQTEASIEWLSPGAVDAVERAAAALQDAYDELEAVVHDIGIPETPVIGEDPRRR